jgi:hypothetical protein
VRHTCRWGILGEQTKKNSLQKESLNEVQNVVWVVIGVVVAAARDYLGDVDSISDIVNLLFALLLWPLVLLGVEFNLDTGGGKDGKGENKNGASCYSPP